MWNKWVWIFYCLFVYRTDKDQKNYIGAICGLGVDKNYGYPAFPDHDMEITFDIKITHEDICKVKHL